MQYVLNFLFLWFLNYMYVISYSCNLILKLQTTSFLLYTIEKLFYF